MLSASSEVISFPESGRMGSCPIHRPPPPRTLELGHRVLSRLQCRKVREALPAELHCVPAFQRARLPSAVCRLPSSPRAAVPSRAPPRVTFVRCHVCTLPRMYVATYVRCHVGMFRDSRVPIQAWRVLRRKTSDKTEFRKIFSCPRAVALVHPSRPSRVDSSRPEYLESSRGREESPDCPRYRASIPQHEE